MTAYLSGRSSTIGRSFSLPKNSIKNKINRAGADKKRKNREANERSREGAGGAGTMAPTFADRAIYLRAAITGIIFVCAINAP